VRTLTLCLAIVTWLLLAGCGFKRPAAVQPPAMAETARQTAASATAIDAAAAHAQGHVASAARNVRDVAAAIPVDAQAVRSASPAGAAVADKLDAYTVVLGKYVLSELKEAASDLAAIQGVAPALQAIAANIKQADIQIAHLAAERDKWKQGYEEEKAKADSHLRTILAWLLVAGVVVLAAGIFVALKVSLQGGVGMCAAGLLLAGAAAFVHQYLDYLAWGAAVALAGVLALMVWMLWIRTKGFTETAQFIEAMKPNLSPGQLAGFFGTDGSSGLVHEIVSPAQSALYQWAVKAGLVTQASIPPAADPPAPAAEGAKT